MGGKDGDEGVVTLGRLGKGFGVCLGGGRGWGLDTLGGGAGWEWVVYEVLYVLYV